MDHHFELYQDKAGQYRFRFRANNGQIIAASAHGNRARGKTKNDIVNIQQGRADVEFFKDQEGQHRWRLVHNNEIVATSEGYRAKSSARHSLESLLNRAPKADVEILT